MKFPKNKTFRSERYKKYIRGKECEVKDTACGGSIVSHHTETGGTAIKGSDLSCVPLCAKHHLVIHQGGKKTFAETYLIDINEILVECLQGYIEEVEGGED